MLVGLWDGSTCRHAIGDGKLVTEAATMNFWTDYPMSELTQSRFQLSTKWWSLQGLGTQRQARQALARHARLARSSGTDQAKSGSVFSQSFEEV